MPAAPLEELQRTLEVQGLKAAMQLLSERVPHRYTVVYKFDGKSFFAIELVDKLNEPPPLLFKEVPFEVSFCQFTVGEGVFRMEDSMQDARLDGHIHQKNVQSYTGLPLEDATGRLYGTFCHLDMIPQELPDSEYRFLQEATSVLGPHLPETSKLYKS